MHRLYSFEGNLAVQIIAFFLSPLIMAPIVLFNGFAVYCLWMWYIPLPALTFIQSTGVYLVAALLTGNARYDSDTNKNEIRHYGRILLRTAIILFIGLVGHIVT